METATVKKTTKKDYRKIILEGFIQEVLENGSEPASVFKFAKSLKMKEEDMYTYFTSFDSIKSTIWTDILTNTLQDIQSQEAFAGYTAREMFLGFLFTWVEELKKNRSYLLVLYGDKLKGLRSFAKDTKEFKSKFKSFAEEIIQSGKESSEIASRPYISEKYEEALWLQVAFIFRFWLDDTSPRFEKTDAAIEKSANLAFDLMGKSALDTFLDFAKFLYQNK